MSTLAKNKKPKKSKEIEEDLPSLEEASHAAGFLYKQLDAQHLQSFLARLQKIAQKPPQVLLIEGGDSKIRFAIAKYWAALLNCKDLKRAISHQEGETSYAPCLSCVNCIEIANELAPDFKVYNGLKKTIAIGEMRELKPLIAIKPFQFNQRIALFYEASAFSEEAANAILKILEEPNNTTSFVFTVPIREQILPTLVSRSHVMILPSLTHAEADNKENEMAQDLYVFLSSGKSFFVKYSSKADFSKEDGQYVIHLLSLYLTKALISFTVLDSTSMHNDAHVEHALTSFLKEKINLENTQTFINILNEAQSMLTDIETPVNPSLVIDTMLIQLVMLLQ